MKNEKTRKKLSIQRFGKNNPFAKKIKIDDNIYECLIDSLQDYSISYSTLRRRLKSKKYKNYNYIT